MENKVVKYECRGCKQYLERREFHYQQFETAVPRKLCWGCEKDKYVNDAVNKYKDATVTKFEYMDKQIKNLQSIIRTHENLRSIKVPVKTNKIPKYKHHSLNVYMEEGNLNDAWMLHKGEFRKYRTYPNQYQEGDSVFVYKRPDGSNKYYGLMKMHQWIMEKKENVKSPF